MLTSYNNSICLRKETFVTFLSTLDAINLFELNYKLNYSFSSEIVGHLQPLFVPMVRRCKYKVWPVPTRYCDTLPSPHR